MRFLLAFFYAIKVEELYEAVVDYLACCADDCELDNLNVSVFFEDDWVWEKIDKSG